MARICSLQGEKKVSQKKTKTVNKPAFKQDNFSGSQATGAKSNIRGENRYKLLTHGSGPWALNWGGKCSGCAKALFN